MADFNKIGLLAIRDNSILMCRKNNYTSKLIMPGGQIDPGETEHECLVREVREELGANASIKNVEYFGTYVDKTASDDVSVDKTVQIRLFKAELLGHPIASSEIIELVWFGPTGNQRDLSDIIRNKILPDLIARREVDWSASSPPRN